MLWVYVLDGLTMIAGHIHTYYSAVEGGVQTLDDLQIEKMREITLAAYMLELEC